MFVQLKNMLRRVRKVTYQKTIPFSGYLAFDFDCPLNSLSDNELISLNQMLDWNCFTTDSKGRRLGNVAWSGKRSLPQKIPDSRIVLMDEKFHLSGKTVLEVGCFEGVHTVGLQMFAANVLAVDSRIEHVVKTTVRSAMYGFYPKTFLFDADSDDQDYSRLRADFAHHVGVLYHLKDPVKHLINLGNQVEKGIMLDTHIAEDVEASEIYTVDGEHFHYKKYLEFGAKEAFSGMHDHSKWLTLSGLEKALKMAGFENVTTVEVRQERNGPRVLLFAEKG